GPALVDEDQVPRVQSGQLLAELSPSLLDLRAVLLLGAGDLLLTWQTELAQGARDRHGAARDAEPLSQFLESGIGLLPDQLAEPLQVLRPEYRGVAAAVAPGQDRAGGAMELRQPGDEGDADHEAGGDLAQGAVTALDCIDYAFPKILRIGSHRSPPYRDLPSNLAPSNCSAL